MPTELILRPVVRDPGRPPGAAAAGLVFGEVELPHLVGAGRRITERRLALRGKPPTLPLIRRLQQQPFVAENPKHRRHRELMPLMACHRPNLVVAPRRMPTGKINHDPS
jgi:hypothetical protein